SPFQALAKLDLSPFPRPLYRAQRLTPHAYKAYLVGGISGEGFMISRPAFFVVCFCSMLAAAQAPTTRPTTKPTYEQLLVENYSLKGENRQLKYQIEALKKQTMQPAAPAAAAVAVAQPATQPTTRPAPKRTFNGIFQLLTVVPAGLK